MKPKSQLQNEARERNSAWNSLTPKQQLEALDNRLGKNVGAEKQRGRLLYEVSSRNIQKAKKVAKAYGAGEATLATIQAQHERRGPAVISAAYKGKDKKLKGERGILLNLKRHPFHLNDQDEEVLIQWDNTKLKGSHGWTKVKTADLKDLRTSEED